MFIQRIHKKKGTYGFLTAYSELHKTDVTQV